MIRSCIFACNIPTFITYDGFTRLSSNPSFRNLSAKSENELSKFFEAIPADECKKMRLETQPQIWDEFWSWIDTLSPTGGSKLEKAVNYAFNHIVLSLIETAKANNLNIYHYLYTLLLYMPDYKNEPAGIEQLLPWSDFIKERCSGVVDTETENPENRGNLSI